VKTANQSNLQKIHNVTKIQQVQKVNKLSHKGLHPAESELLTFTGGASLFSA
jgi:hypothetical protein